MWLLVLSNKEIHSWFLQPRIDARMAATIKSVTNAEMRNFFLAWAHSEDQSQYDSATPDSTILLGVKATKGCDGAAYHLGKK